MFSKIKSYWNYGNSYCSVELTTISGEDTLFSITANKKKDEFVNFQFKKAVSFSEISKLTPKNQHCYLTINTQKVLIKEIPFLENNQKALAKAFPSLSLSDFYYEILKTKNKCFVAICRKEDVNLILKKAADQNIEILGFRLGFSSISNIIPLLKKDSIISFRFQFTILEDELDSFIINNTQDSVSYSVEDTEVNSNYLLPLSGLFNYQTSSNEQSSNFNEENKNLSLLQNQKTFFRKGVLSGVGILLFSLLINFFLFNSYYKTLQTKQEEVRLLKSQKENYLIKSTALKSKERIVQNLLNSNNSKSSFYINRITAYKPNSILFEKIIFQPLQKAIRSDKPIEYVSNEITISGKSSDKMDFSNWIETLENFKWVTSVTVTDYGHSNKNTSSFSVNLIIKTDDTEK